MCVCSPNSTTGEGTGRSCLIAPSPLTLSSGKELLQEVATQALDLTAFVAKYHGEK